MKPEFVLGALALTGLVASAGLWMLVRFDGTAQTATVVDVVGDPIGVVLDRPDGDTPLSEGSAPSAPPEAASGSVERPDAGTEARSESLAPLELAPSALHHAREGARRREARGAVGERDEDGVLVVQFDELELVAYEPPDPDATDAERAARGDVLPELLRTLDGETISIRGYMSPLEFEDDRVTSFVLSRNLPGCCFGVLPRPDEWVEVDVLAEGGVDYLPFGSVVVTGRLEVGEDFDEYGYVTSVYRLQAESVEEPW